MDEEKNTLSTKSTIKSLGNEYPQSLFQAAIICLNTENVVEKAHLTLDFCKELKRRKEIDGSLKLDPSEKLRYANTKLRPIWNGLTYYLLPRTLTFVGYQFRSLSAPTVGIILNGILASLIFIGLVTFFVILMAQIKKVNSRYEYL